MIYDTVEFHVPLNTLQVILETIYSANHLTGAKTSLSNQSESAPLTYALVTYGAIKICFDRLID